MTDLEKEKLQMVPPFTSEADKSHSAGTAPAAKTPAPLPPMVSQRIPTSGEKWFRFFRDWVINFGVNETGSLLLTDQTVREGGFLNGGYEYTRTVLAKKFRGNRRIKQAKEDYGGLLLTFMLNMGGNLLLVPMKILEDHRAPVIQAFNHCSDWLGGNKLTPEQVKARDEEVAYHIAHEPKTTWKSLIASRVLMVSMNLGLNWVIGGERTGKIKNVSENLFTGLAGVPDTNFTNWLAGNEMFKGISRLLLLETFYCANTSMGMALLDDIISGKKKFRQGKNVQVVDSNEKADQVFEEYKKALAALGIGQPATTGNNTGNNSRSMSNYAPRQLQSFADSMVPSESYAKARANEKAAASETPLGQSA